MLTPTQTVQATQEAFSFIAANPLAHTQALREHLQGWMLTTFAAQPEYWGEATDVVVQDIVLLTQRKAFAAADQAAKDAADAQVLADWKARMDAMPIAAPVYATVYVPPAPKTYADHIEAIKAAYGEDMNLQAACRYALLNGITPDQVAGATFRHHTDCHNLMYPG